MNDQMSWHENAGPENKGPQKQDRIKCFYSASALLAMQSAVLARGIPSVRPSVCPSRSGIVSRRMKIRSCGLQHLVGQSL